MINIQNISKSYKDKKVLHGVSFNVKKGEPFAIIGRNGAGKSTTLKIILGMLAPDGGSVQTEGQLKIGYLPEERGTYAETTVYDHMQLFGKLSHISNLEDEITRAIERFELTEYKEKKVKDLSKGNAQKLLLALTFLGHSNLIILDEPLSGLDPINKNLLKKIIHEERDNSYIMVSSHQMEFVEEICSEVMFLKDGRVIEAGLISELKRKYGTPSLVIPYSEAHMATLHELGDSLTRERNTIVIPCRENKDALFAFIMRKLPDIEYVKYQYGDIDDMYMQLLGEGSMK